MATASVVVAVAAKGMVQWLASTAKLHSMSRVCLTAGAGRQHHGILNQQQHEDSKERCSLYNAVLASASNSSTGRQWLSNFLRSPTPQHATRFLLPGLTACSNKHNACLAPALARSGMVWQGLSARHLQRHPPQQLWQQQHRSLQVQPSSPHGAENAAKGSDRVSSPPASAACKPPANAPPAPSSEQQEDSVWTAPNLLSLSRAASAPLIAALILHDMWPWAVVATAVSGLTDWADGALARHLKQSSVLGSYLDPLADKALVACVVGALAYKGLAPAWLAVLVVGRDVLLVVGMSLHRWRSLGWRVQGVTAAEFFATGSEAVPMMRPILISKVNTVLQLLLVSGCMTHAWVQLPDAGVLHQLEVLTAGTTVASLATYAWLYGTGRMLDAGRVPP